MKGLEIHGKIRAKTVRTDGQKVYTEVHLHSREHMPGLCFLQAGTFVNGDFGEASLTIPQLRDLWTMIGHHLMAYEKTEAAKAGWTGMYIGDKKWPHDWSGKDKP